MRETRPILTADALLARYPDEVRAAVGVLRDVVREVLPEAEERVYPGWRAIGFRHPAVGYFCGIFPQEKGVNLAFEQGAQLYDPTGLLVVPPNGGRTVRYAKYRDSNEIDLATLTHLLLQAAAMTRPKAP